MHCGAAWKVPRSGLVHTYRKILLLDQEQVRALYTPLFGGHLCSVPQGMIFDVQPLVKGTLSLLRLRRALQRALRRAVWVTIPEDKQNSAAYIHTFFTYRLPPPPHTSFFSYLIDLPLFGPLSFTNGAFDSVPNAVWAHKMVVVEEPPLILFPGPPRRQGLCSHSALFWVPEKGGVR